MLKTPLKLLWLDLNSSYSHASLALPAIHAQTLQDQTLSHVNWSVVRGTINSNLTALATEVANAQPDLIAATCWLFTHDYLIQVLSRIHVLCPTSQIVLGGPEFLGDNELFLRRNRFISCVFRGEGEESFPAWLHVWQQPSKWTEISGICYLKPEVSLPEDRYPEVSTSGISSEQKQTLYKETGIARVAKFDQLAPPETSPFFDWKKPFVQLETTRGCFNSCAFCVSGSEKPVRSLSPETLRKRLETICAHGIREVRLLDRTFNANSTRAEAMLELFQSFAPELRFHLEIHPALISEPLKELLRKLPAGLLHLEAGIQSLRDPVLRACNRSGTVDKSLAGLQFLCGLSNLDTHTDLIAGLPGYTFSEICEDIRTLAELGAAEIQLELLKLLPGTPFRHDAEQLGLRYAPTPPYEILETPSSSPTDLNRSRLLSKLLDNFYNTSLWRPVTQTLLREEPQFLTLFLAQLESHGSLEHPLSMESRGTLFYHFLRENFAEYCELISRQWISGGLSLSKEPSGNLRTHKGNLPAYVRIESGIYTPEARLYVLPGKVHSYWFGFDRSRSLSNPSCTGIE